LQLTIGPFPSFDNRRAIRPFLKIIPAAWIQRKGPKALKAHPFWNLFEKLKGAILLGLEISKKNLSLCIFSLAFYGAEIYINF
jgi:hypothetical protein